MCAVHSWDSAAIFWKHTLLETLASPCPHKRTEGWKPPNLCMAAIPSPLIPLLLTLSLAPTSQSAPEHKSQLSDLSLMSSLLSNPTLSFQAALGGFIYTPIVPCSHLILQMPALHRRLRVSSLSCKDQHLVLFTLSLYRSLVCTRQHMDHASLL